MLHVTDIQRISVDVAGNQANGVSRNAVFSPDGTKVAFTSTANNLVAGDANSAADIFVKDLTTGVITLVSADAVGNQANGGSYNSSFSPDGTKVAFASAAGNLVAGDTNSAVDVFVKDLATGAITRASADAIGNQTNGGSYNPVISPDGMKVAFESDANNLVAGDTNGARDVFIKNLATGAITRVSTDAIGNEGDSESSKPAFSPDGTKVVFESYSANLVATGDTFGSSELYVKDLATGAISLISTDAAGNPGIGSSYYPVFSPDGTKVAFTSEAAGLVTPPAGGFNAIFVKNLITGAVIHATTDAAGNSGNSHNTAYIQLIPPAFSPDGNKVAFTSNANNLVAGDTNDSEDVFIKDLTTGIVTRIPTDAAEFNDPDYPVNINFNPVFSPDGTKLLFGSIAQGLVAGDDNHNQDIFIVTLANGDNIPGTSGSDNLTGGEGDDTISGFAGNDRLFGGLGDDSILGGDGRDRIEGNEGDDTIDGGIGDDTIRGGDGEDSLLGGSGDDTIYGNEGDDYINGGNSADSLQGGNGSDTIYGGSAADLLRGGEGDDIGYGESGADDLRMGVGDDTLNGGGGADKLYGEAGADQFVFDEQAFSAVDRIKDFSVADGDSVLLSSILIGFNPVTSAISDFVKFTDSASSAQLLVDRDGIGASYGFERIAVIEHLSGQDVQTWYDGGSLVVA